MSKVCDRAGCSNVFEPPVNNPHQKYCSTYCRHKAKRVRYSHTLVDRVCPTCGNTYQTSELSLRMEQKNYCSDDCKPVLERKVYECECTRCHGIFMAGTSKVRYCVECRVEIDRERGRRDWRKYYSRPTYAKRICVHCSKEFVPEHGAQIYHSKQCAENASKATENYKKRRSESTQRRNDRSRKPLGSDKVYRAKIFARDGWRCQLCGKKVNKELKWPHPLSATLDHILPLARGGHHVPENCQLAHFICNSRRSDRGEAQLRLFA